MSTVAAKTKDPQAHAMLFRTRDLLVRQRTQLINALRGHMAEYGLVATRAKANLRCLEKALSEPDNGLPALVAEIGQTHLDQIAGLIELIASLETRLHVEAARDTAARRAQTMPRGRPGDRDGYDRFRATRGDVPPRGGTLLPGSVWSRNSIQRVANPGSGEPPKWASATFEGF